MRRSLLLLSALLGAVVFGCDATGTVQGGAPLVADPCAATGNAATWSALYTCYFGPTGKASCAAQSTCHGGPTQTGTLASGYMCIGGSTPCWQSMTQCAVMEAGAPGDDGGDDGGEDGGDGAGGDAARDATLDAPGDAPHDATVDGPADATLDAPGDAIAEAAGDAPGEGGADGADSGPTCGCPPTAQTPIALPVPCTSGDPTRTMLFQVLRGGNGLQCPTPTSPGCMPYGGGYTFTQADLDRISAWIKSGAPNN